MKIRAGFVSNSSASSFLVLLPSDFDFDNIDLSEYQNKMDDNECDEAEVKRAFGVLSTMGELWQPDSPAWFVLSEILNPYVINTEEIHSDGEGKISLVDGKGRQKIQDLMK